MHRSARAVELTKYTVTDNGCWEWTGARCPMGYGKVAVQLADGRRSSTNAHRLFYEYLVEHIKPGLQLDHLCRNTSCVNPAHLEPVTNGENIWRAIRDTRPTCPQGHLYTPENTWHDGKTRRCRECRRTADREAKRVWRASNADVIRQRNRRYYERNREKLVEAARRRRADG